MTTYYSHWQHALLTHDDDFISTQTVSLVHQTLYNDIRFSLFGYTESLEDGRLTVEILRGSPALSAFRIDRLLARFQTTRPLIHTTYTEYIHFTNLSAPLNNDEYA